MCLSSGHELSYSLSDMSEVIFLFKHEVQTEKQFRCPLCFASEHQTVTSRAPGVHLFITAAR